VGETQDGRVLIFAPGRDGALTRDVLAGDGLCCVVAADLGSFHEGMAVGAGVLVIAEEALTAAAATRLISALSVQPAWSDLPILIVTGAGGAVPVGRALKPLDVLGNVSVLCRPLSIDALVTAVRSALRARARQYEVRDLLAARDEADARKDEFLAMLAHELRNPLAPIRSAARVLRLMNTTDPALDEVRGVIDRQVRHMAQMVDDLLDVSRINRGEIELRRQAVDLHEVAGHAIGAVAPLMAAKGHTLTAAEAQGPLLLDADPVRLEQILTNLLNNAAKYTDEGGRVRFSAVAEGPTAVVRVKDSGVGIGPKVLPRIFDLFTQADRPLDRTQGGLGIGLTVVKRLVELHGGSVQAASEGPGLGTEVTLRFPLLTDHRACPTSADTRSEFGAAAAADPCDRRAFRILVVEDNRDGARMLARVLRLEGHETRVVHDGTSAVAAALEFRPDVVLSDIGLPGMNGYEVAATLKRNHQMTRALFVAVSGYGRKVDLSLSKAAGFDHHLTKPLDVAHLNAILTDHTGGRADACAPLA